MKWILRGSLALSVFIGAALVGVYVTGNGKILKIFVTSFIHRPALPFDPATSVPAPDYALDENWAALPNKQDYADRVPNGVVDFQPQGGAPADVFFIHPTGYLAGQSWTYSMEKESGTEENTHWMMANQASAYNGCCNVYAPRYRQALFFAFLAREKTRAEILDVAYQDVEQAFKYYLEHYNNGRPFVIASHSQGSVHAVSLIQKVIDGTPLAKQMVAAYAIGAQIKNISISGMQDVDVCESDADLNCMIHWDTYSDSAIDRNFSKRADRVCVNPLSWRVNGGLANKDLHRGGVVPSGKFNGAMSGPDTAMGVELSPLGAPLSASLSAQCKNGVLFVSDQDGTPFGRLGRGLDEGNYHLLDYSLFYMDIRENAKLRVDTFLQKQGRQVSDLSPLGLNGRSNSF
ncbi:MAG: DUF3089 domain-containing protein [Agarilytica sp.]